MKRVAMTVLASGLLGLGATTMTACKSDGGGGGWFNKQSFADYQNLFNTWTLDSLEGTKVGELLPDGISAPSLNISEDGDIAGTAGVNRFNTGIDLNALAKGQFRLDQEVLTTKMAGTSQQLAFEDNYLNLLEDARQFKLSDGALRLLDSGGSEILKFISAG